MISLFILARTNAVQPVKQDSRTNMRYPEEDDDPIMSDFQIRLEHKGLENTLQPVGFHVY